MVDNSIIILLNNDVIAKSQTRGFEQRPRRPKRRRGITRERVLDAAEELFLKNGFAATTVQDVAQAAGYTTGAIYSNFGGKAELFFAVFRRRVDSQQDVWRDALDSIRTSKDAAAAMGNTLRASTYEPEWYAAVFEFFSFAARHPQLRGETAELLRLTHPLLEEVLGHVSESAPLPIDRLAQIVTGLMRGLAWTWVVDPEAADDSLFADAVAVLIGAQSSSGARRKNSNRSTVASRRAPVAGPTAARARTSSMRGGAGSTPPDADFVLKEAK